MERGVTGLKPLCIPPPPIIRTLPLRPYVYYYHLASNWVSSPFSSLLDS